MRAEDFYRITAVAETDSTNAQVKLWAAAGEAEGAVLTAEAQSAGRGRMGRRFHSPAGTGLYLSVLLRPALFAEQTPLLTTAAAVAVCRAIEAVAGRRADIKWVNDILMDGKKVCGILAEGVPGEYAVLGVGVNLAEPPGGFPKDIADIAGAVFDGPAAADAQKSGLTARFLEEFYELYLRLPDAGYLSEYRRRCHTLGKRVRVPAAPPYEATAETIDESGALLVRTDGGALCRIAAGEVSLTPLP